MYITPYTELSASKEPQKRSKLSTVYSDPHKKLRFSRFAKTSHRTPQRMRPLLLETLLLVTGIAASISHSLYLYDTAIYYPCTCLWIVTGSPAPITRSTLSP